MDLYMFRYYVKHYESCKKKQEMLNLMKGEFSYDFAIPIPDTVKSDFWDICAFRVFGHFYWYHSRLYYIQNLD